MNYTKVDTVITFDQELTLRERTQLHAFYDLPGPEGVIQVIPAAPNRWFGRLPSTLGVDLTPLLGADTVLVIASGPEDLLDVERSFLQGIHQELGLWFEDLGPTETLPGGRSFALVRIRRFSAEELPELESLKTGRDD